MEMLIGAVIGYWWHGSQGAEQPQPAVLSAEEIAALLRRMDDPRYRAMAGIMSALIR
jgi:hypothetical protein